MKHVIVPVFSQSDLEALPNCLRYLAQQPVETLLVLHGPNVGVVNADATQEFDRKITELDTRKRELTLVEDFAGAQRTKEEIEKLRVDRDIAIRDGWKKVPEEQRKAAYAKAFANLGTEPICLREAYQAEQVFAMLQSFLPQWPSDVPHGEYSIIWPRSVATVSAQKQALPIVPSTGKPIGTVTNEGFDARTERKYELQNLHHLKVFRIAADAGIPTKGLKTPAVIKAILDKEFPAQQAAA